ncbi:hypothetical protein ACO1O0_001729 [Amphichorda felina]
MTRTSSSTEAPTFCKCTCFKNSTIIPLGPAHQSEAAHASASALRRSPGLFGPDPGSILVSPRTASTHCSECTKSFCLNQGIDICEKADEDDVMTLCFKRDSNKDKIIVWGFIVGTCALLGWALFKHLAAWREGRRFARQDMSYAPISAGGR